MDVHQLVEPHYIVVSHVIFGCLIYMFVFFTGKDPKPSSIVITRSRISSRGPNPYEFLLWGNHQDLSSHCTPAYTPPGSFLLGQGPTYNFPLMLPFPISYLLSNQDMRQA